MTTQAKLKFCEYEHMENHYNITSKIKEVLDQTSHSCRVQLQTECSFVAMEKVHGTNYSLMTNGLTVEPCKRSSSLGADRGYFGHGPIYEKYKSDMLILFTEISKIYSRDDQIVLQIQLYGELFGGLYQGKTATGYKKVQKMNYCPFNDFIKPSSSSSTSLIVSTM